MGDGERFFGLTDLDHSEAARIVGAIRPPRIKDARRAVAADWVTRFRQRDNTGWAEIIHDVADGCPIKVRRLEQACTYTEIAEAYAWRKAGQYGVGFKYEGE